MADNKTSIIITASDQASRTIGDIKTRLGTLGAAAGGLVPQLAALTSAMSVGGFVAWTKSTIDAADNLNDLSQRIGIGVEKLASWQLAASQNGTSMEALAVGVKKLSTYMVEHQDRLKAAGITAKDANGALIQLADIFAAMPDGVEKTALAVQLFGKAGTELIPLLNQGGKGLAEAAAKSEEYAKKMKELAPQADAFNDQLAEMNLQWQVFGVTIGNMVIGPLTELVSLMNQLAAGGPKAYEAVERLAQSGSPLVRGVAKWNQYWNGKEAPLPRGVSGRIAGGASAPMLPGANSPAEAAAIARARALMDKGGSGGGKTYDVNEWFYQDTKKSLAEDDAMLKKWHQDMDAKAKKEADALSRYREMIDPLQKYRDMLAEIDTLTFANVDEKLAAQMKVNEMMDDEFDRMNKVNDTLSEQKNLARDLGMTFQSAFEDAVIGGKKFSEVMKGLGQDILRLVLRKSITEPLATAFSAIDFGKLFGGGVPQYATGTNYVPQDGLAYLHKGEAVVPAALNGAGGINIVVNNTAAPGVEASATARNNNGQIDIDVIVQRAIAKDMSRNGPITQGFGSMFGLARAI